MKELRIIEFKIRMRNYLSDGLFTEAENLATLAHEDVKSDALCNRYISLAQALLVLNKDYNDEKALNTLSTIHKIDQNDRYIQGFYFYIAALRHSTKNIDDSQTLFAKSLECLPHSNFIQTQYLAVMKNKAECFDLSHYKAKHLQMLENVKTLDIRIHNNFKIISEKAVISDKSLSLNEVKEARDKILNNLKISMIIDSTNLHLVSEHCKLFLLTAENIKPEIYAEAMRMFVRNSRHTQITYEGCRDIIARNLYSNFVQSQPFQLIKDIPEMKTAIIYEPLGLRIRLHQDAIYKLDMNTNYLKLLIDPTNSKLWTEMTPDKATPLFYGEYTSSELKDALLHLSPSGNKAAISAIRKALSNLSSVHPNSQTARILLWLIAEIEPAAKDIYKLYGSISQSIFTDYSLSEDNIHNFERLTKDNAFQVECLSNLFITSSNLPLNITIIETRPTYKILQYFSLLQPSDQELLLQSTALQSKLYSDAKKLQIEFSNAIMHLTLSDAAIKVNENEIVRRFKQIINLYPLYPYLSLDCFVVLNKLPGHRKDTLIPLLINNDLILTFGHDHCPESQISTDLENVFNLKTAFQLLPNIRMVAININCTKSKAALDLYYSTITSYSYCKTIITTNSAYTLERQIIFFASQSYERTRHRDEAVTKLSLCAPEIPNEIWENLWRFLSDTTRDSVRGI